MTGETVGEVVASGDPAFAPGDIAFGHAAGRPTRSAGRRSYQGGCRQRAALHLPRRLGMPGTTAYAGVTEI